MAGSISKALAEDESLEAEQSSETATPQNSVELTPSTAAATASETIRWLVPESIASCSLGKSFLHHGPSNTPWVEIHATADLIADEITGLPAAVSLDSLGVYPMQSPLQFQQIPDIWTSEYQMGSRAYVDALVANQQSGFNNGQEWIQSNSAFSDHILVLKQLLLNKLDQLGPAKRRSYEVATAFVVEATLSELLVDAPPVMVCIPVIDLIASMCLGEQRKGTCVLATLPAPDVATLFSPPEHARLVFRHLNMDRGVSCYKMDPAFFWKYPDLYDPTSCIVASGIPLKPMAQTTATHPDHLDALTVGTYRNFIDFSLDASVEMTAPSGTQLGASVAGGS
ncbi:hypothetical protein TOPH_04827 [Tolypocladium ophioglossoides CBS 100239]|uniref:Uncharacterized protein n=1 Tax=Tolypocladium ophioglossoides (strain CBS 100239) TaxID=1163406 RepID=A0A0L0N9S3_TOLOC|nr:hypothetical protein TOPH_04827 [Tolypocladium ophioglossoides CBS 100239]